jgi:hypothetical protein
MHDPHLETLTFALFAVVLGVVIFGGTTLTYFLAKRPPKLSPPHERVQSLPGRPTASRPAAPDEWQCTAA